MVGFVRFPVLPEQTVVRVIPVRISLTFRPNRCQPKCPIIPQKPLETLRLGSQRMPVALCRRYPIQTLIRHNIVFQTGEGMVLKCPHGKRQLDLRVSV